MNRSAKIHRWLGNFVFYWGFVQVALIGLAFFGAASSELHAYGGVLLSVAALIMLITAIIGKLGGSQIGLSLLMLLLLFPGQGFLIHMEGLAPAVRALHPMIGIAVMFLGRYLAAQVKDA
jgi:hypothetical protein